MNKRIKFYVHQLIIESGEFALEDFNDIKKADTETVEIRINDKSKETITIKQTEKTIYGKRFIGLYFKKGDKYPYVPKVINPEFEEIDNPRLPDQIELDNQLFVLIDVKTQRIWISNYREKQNIIDWLQKNLQKEVSIKSIIEEKEFVDKIESIREISFSVAPNLFSSLGILSQHLADDIYGFDAEEAKVTITYKNRKISDKIKGKINNIISKRNSFKEITVIGRSDEAFCSTFNAEGVISKVSFDLDTDQSSKLFSPDIVFSTLIEKIKKPSTI